jgi:hypothetical protein
MSPLPQPRTTRRFGLFVLLMLLGMVAAVVDARRAEASVVFGYDGFCLGACPDIGLRRFGAVSGEIVFATAAVAPNATLSTEDIVDFSLDFGAVEIDFASAFGFNFLATLDAEGDGFTEFQMIVGDTFDAEGGMILLDTTGWAAGVGGCTSLDCADFFIFDPAFGLGAFARTGELPDPVVPVPAPATALLVMAPLATLLRRDVSRSRRTQPESAAGA